MRYLTSRRILIFLGITVVTLTVAAGAFLAYLESDAFKTRARQYIVDHASIGLPPRKAPPAHKRKP